MDFSEADPLLNFYVHFVVHWVQIWVHRPDDMNVNTEAVCARSLSRHIVLLDDKELTTDLVHNRQLLLSKKYVTVIV